MSMMRDTLGVFTVNSVCILLQAETWWNSQGDLLLQNPQAF